MHFDLTYIVNLDNNYSVDQLVRDISVGFSGISGIKSWTENSDNYIDQEQLVTYTTLGNDNSYQVFIKISGDRIGIKEGGLSRFATIIFGNPFRHDGVQNVFLTKIEFSTELANHFKGPVIGLEGLKTFFKEKSFPLKSVPLPIDLHEQDKHKLIGRLVKNGINIVTESPIYNSTKNELLRDIKYFERLQKKISMPFIYFVNSTVILDRIFDYIEIISELNSNNNFKIGLRLCPLSVGFNTCLFIRKFNIPIYGYNLLNIANAEGGKYCISSGALSKIMRIVGCDLINVGLRAKNILRKPVSNEIISAATKGHDQNFKQSIPVFTGSLTPRTAYQVVSEYGSNIGLHVKKPLLRSGLSGNELEKNISAFCEAIELAKLGIPIDKAMEREDGQTKFWRDYENKFGTE